MIARLFTALVIVVPGTAHAFPPYRLTDADTADPWTLEARLGARVFRAADDTTYGAPALRVNLGLPHHIELVSELEIEPEAPAIADAAIGAKLVLARKPLSYGIEALALLPTSSAGGAGAEASLLATYRTDRLRVHVNATGFYDARPADAESGWKGGVLGEVVVGSLRPGVELFAKQVFGDDAQVLAGTGAIVGLTQQLDVRVGVHAGLTDAAPDVVGSIWIAGKLPLQ